MRAWMVLMWMGILWKVMMIVNTQGTLPPVITEGDKACAALVKNVASTEVCTKNILSEENYTCCFITFEVRDYKNSFCRPIANSLSAIQNVEESFGNAKSVSILCNHTFLSTSPFISLLLLLLIITN